MALTPCQIGGSHENVGYARCAPQVCYSWWCQNDTSKTYVIRDTVEWLGRQRH